MTLKKILLKLRNQINELDELILHLLSQRRKIAIKIAKKKIINNFPIKDKNREQELLQELYHIGKMYQLPQEYIRNIFNTIIKDSVTVQKIIKTKLIQQNNLPQVIFSCLGPQGSYSHIASIKYIKKYYKEYILKKYNNFKDIFHAIISNQSDYAIVPIENSTSGFIDEVYNLLCTEKLKIFGECYLPIRHCLLTKPKTILDHIKNIYSHKQAFQQCSNFIKKFNKCHIQYTNSTSEAMHIVEKIHTNDVAAIGDKSNAKLYNLKVILENLSNQPDNHTRFLILTKNKTIVSETVSKKITLILTTQTILLFYIITLLYTQKIAIIQLKSELKFKSTVKEIIYLEIAENIKQKNIQEIFTILKKKNISITVLGCYPTYNIL